LGDREKFGGASQVILVNGAVVPVKSVKRDREEEEERGSCTLKENREGEGEIIE
jgi:hypothetical protein